MSMLLYCPPTLRHITLIPTAYQQNHHFHRWSSFIILPHVIGLMQPVDTSEIKGEIYSTTIPYDYLVYAVGAEVQTFNIPGVKEHACFMKELTDAERVRFSRIPLSMAY